MNDIKELMDEIKGLKEALHKETQMTIVLSAMVNEYKAKMDEFESQVNEYKSKLEQFESHREKKVYPKLKSLLLILILVLASCSTERRFWERERQPGLYHKKTPCKLYPKPIKNFR